MLISEFRYYQRNYEPLQYYCDAVWSSCTQEESRRLESLLNFGYTVVLCKRRDFSSATALHELGLTTLNSRRKLHTVQCMFRCLSSQAPSYLTRLFSSTTQHHNTRSSSTRQLNLPPVKSSRGQRHLVLLVLSGVVYLRPSARHRILGIFQNNVDTHSNGRMLDIIYEYIISCY